MRFREELESVLPADLPHCEGLVAGATRHLERIEAANREFNLTRIVNAREAAIKHVLDSVFPWRHFVESRHVLDAGTGAGFPGIPLALIFPEKRFVLCDSVGKKARFVESVARELDLKNVTVLHVRAEEWLRKNAVDTITARAVTPVSNACVLFGPAMRAGSRGLLYKGPDIGEELRDAAVEMSRRGLSARVVQIFDLPDQMGERTVVQMVRASGRVAREQVQ